MTESDKVAPFLPESFNIKIKEIFEGELVGKGNFSTVHKGIHLGKYVAVKKQEITDDDLEKYLLNELAILRFCDHEHIIKYIGAGKAPDGKMIFSVTEFVPGGDLSMLLKSDIDIGWMNKANILWKVADALYYLHENGIIHRDIKTDNVMLTLDLKPKLIDLGFARVAEPEDSTRAMTCLGTDEYMAPEVTFAMPYHFPADAFSLGIVIFELCYGIVPKRTAANGFCVEWDEARTMLEEKKTPKSLSLLIEQSASDEPEERLDMIAVSEWLEELVGDLKKEGAAIITLNEEDVMKRIKTRWAHILKYDGDEEALLKLDRNDMETNFLDEQDNINEEMSLRRQSVNRALQMRAHIQKGFGNDSGRLSEVSFKTDDDISQTNSHHEEDTLKEKRSRKDKEWQKITKKSKGKSAELHLPDIQLNNALIPNKAKGHIGDKSARSRTSFFMSFSSTKRKPLKPGKKKRLFKTNLRISKKRVVSSVDEDTSTEKADFVYKRLQFGFSAWVKEYLVLSPEGLLYFKNKRGFRKNEVTGALLFMDMVPQQKQRPAIDVSIIQAGKPFCFQVLNKERKIVFQASNQINKIEWIKKINKGYMEWKAKQPTS